MIAVDSSVHTIDAAVIAIKLNMIQSHHLSNKMNDSLSEHWSYHPLFGYVYHFPCDIAICLILAIMTLILGFTHPSHRPATKTFPLKCGGRLEMQNCIGHS